MSHHKNLLISFLFLLLYTGALVFAVPPLTPYAPGETLDPDCAPEIISLPSVDEVESSDTETISEPDFSLEQKKMKKKMLCQSKR